MSIAMVGGSALRVLVPIIAGKIADRFGIDKVRAETVAETIVEPVAERVSRTTGTTPEAASRDILEDAVDTYFAEHGETIRIALKLSSERLIADAASEDPFIRRTRPFVVRWAVAVVSYLIALVPVLSLFPFLEHLDDNTMVMIAAVPPALWTLLTVGIGLWTASRGVEKVVERWQKPSQPSH